MTPTNTPREEALEYINALASGKYELIPLEKTKHLETIRAALSQTAPIEGLDEALKIYDRQVHPGLRNDAVWLHPIVKAAKAYAQGRTQAVPDGWKLVPANIKMRNQNGKDNPDHFAWMGRALCALPEGKGGSNVEMEIYGNAILSAAPTPSVTGGGEDGGEWFFRWIARGKAKHAGMTMEQCADMIWHHPSNPYRENNPWEEPPQPESGEQ